MEHLDIILEYLPETDDDVIVAKSRECRDSER